jgi:hypothetical protein
VVVRLNKKVTFVAENELASSLTSTLTDPGLWDGEVQLISPLVT